MAEVLIEIACPRCAGSGIGGTVEAQDQVYVEATTGAARCPNCGYTWDIDQTGNAMTIHVDYSNEAFRPSLGVVGALEAPSTYFVRGRGGYPPYSVSTPIPAELPAGLTIDESGYAHSDGSVVPGSYVIHVNVLDSLGFHSSSTVTVEVA